MDRPPHEESRAYKSYLLGVLLLIFAATNLDRHAISLMMQDIKVDLGLSDTQLGLLTGIAFSAFYAVMGIPIARWADRGNRITIISLTTALFSVAIAACGAVSSFGQLLAARISAAVGEAGAQPSALSLISDHFTREERPRAVARYMLGVPISLIGGFFIAGWLNELFGWRTTLFVLGVPGLILALLVRLTLREPRRLALCGAAGDRGLSAGAADSAPRQSVFASLWGIVAYRYLLVAISIQIFFAAGVLQWQPSFFVRSYGLSTGELGTWIAGVYGATGLLGTWLGGELAMRYAAGDEARQLIGVALANVVLAIVKPAVYLLPDYHLAFGVLAIVSLFAGMTTGPVFAAIQTAVPAPMRATSIAVVLLFSHLIGAGLGPLAAGMLSDALQQRYGDEALRYVLVSLSPGYILAVVPLLLASRHLKRQRSGETGDGRP